LAQIDRWRAGVLGGNIWARGIPMNLVRIVAWPVAMSYGGFIMTGQRLRTFNNLSVTEASLGALTGFFLAIMFRLREKRHRRPAFAVHPIGQIFPEWNVPNPKLKRDDD
jgi:hypothetical protein